MSWEVFTLAMLGVLGWFWLSSMRVREHAVDAGRRACATAGVQFLDDTVALTKTRLARNDNGQLQFVRHYRFEFSDTGDNRRPGHISAMGERIETVEMDGDCLAGSAQVISIDD
ncbi:MAG: DUF3301 domain-containing protein [Thiobacillaceae bacterium]